MWVRPGTDTEWWTIQRWNKMAVQPTASGLTVQCQTQLASRISYWGLRNVSLKRQISTPSWLRKCSDSKFPPRTPSAFQQARRRALHSSVQERAAIFGYKRITAFRIALGRAAPVGEGRDGRENPKIELHTCMEGR